MKKELIIEMEEECISCPKLSLETQIFYGNSTRILHHTCEHLEFCKAVRQNWERVKGLKDAKK